MLKCLRATTRQVLATYDCQVLLLGAGGCLLGLALARLAGAWLPPGMGLELWDLEGGLTASAVVPGVGIGLLVSTLFSRVPLLHLKARPALWLLRPGHVAARAANQKASRSLGGPRSGAEHGGRPRSPDRSPVEAFYWLTLASRDPRLAPQTATPRLSLQAELTSEELRSVEEWVKNRASQTSAPP